MPKQPKESDAYILDTYKSSKDGAYLPGAIPFAGRKKKEPMQWHDKHFATQQEADRFVRAKCDALGLKEAANEDVILRNNPK